jgi:hypothetical protein
MTFTCTLRESIFYRGIDMYKKKEKIIGLFVTVSESEVVAVV